MLTDKEVLALEKVLIRDNKKIKAIAVDYGYGGIGNTNTCAYTALGKGVTSLERLSGQPIEYSTPAEGIGGDMYGGGFKSEEGYAVAAVADDVVYVVTKSFYSGERKVTRVKLGDSFYRAFEIAYDTEFEYTLAPSESEDGKLMLSAVKVVSYMDEKTGDMKDGKPKSGEFAVHSGYIGELDDVCIYAGDVTDVSAAIEIKYKNSGSSFKANAAVDKPGVIRHGGAECATRIELTLFVK